MRQFVWKAAMAELFPAINSLKKQPKTWLFDSYKVTKSKMKLCCKDRTHNCADQTVTTK